ncbi:hypothetical protein YC2023_057547 [Brassica napus]
MRNYGFHPKEIKFKELKSCLVGSNQVGIKPDITEENQEIDLEYLPGHMIDRSIIRDRSICMKSSFADRVKWTMLIRCFTSPVDGPLSPNSSLQRQNFIVTHKFLSSPLKIQEKKLVSGQSVSPCPWLSTNITETKIYTHAYRPKEKKKQE